MFHLFKVFNFIAFIFKINVYKFKQNMLNNYALICKIFFKFHINENYII